MRVWRLFKNSLIRMLTEPYCMIFLAWSLKQERKTTEISEQLTHSVQKPWKLLFFSSCRSNRSERPKYSFSTVQKPSEIYFGFCTPTKNNMKTQLFKVLLFLSQEEMMDAWLRGNCTKTETKRLNLWTRNLMEQVCFWGNKMGLSGKSNS